MSSDTTLLPNGGSSSDQPTLNIVLQFLQHMDIKNPTPWRILSAKENALKPEFHIDVTVEKRTETEFSSTIHFAITIPDPEKKGQDTLYKLELRYCVVFEIRNAGEDILPLLLFVQGPALLFPYLRELVSNATQHSGLPPVNLNPVNFFELFQRKVAQEKSTS